MKKIIKHWPLLLVVAVAFLIGLFIGGGDSAPEAKVEHAEHDHGQKSEQIWTCSMHPQIRQPKPGKCPICAMDLVPAESGETGKENPRQLKLSSYALKLAEIQTAPVESRPVAANIRLVGKIEHDETRLGYITARFPGRIEHLYVDFTGIMVKKGDKLVSLYSPELITAQQELLQALKSGAGSSYAAAAREKLKLWGLTTGQIRAIEKRGKPSNQLALYSPLSGIVINKHAAEGVYVKTGSTIYTIADLSRVWVKLDAYEADISQLRVRQTVEFTTEAYPGENFTGQIVFIDPVINPKTRTIKVRLNAANPQYRLKPEMFVRAVVKSEIQVTGTQTIIPASAPLVTGKRAVVYVAVPGEAGTFTGREIVLGPRAGDFYIVNEGLSAGEEVVVNGAFKIDSDLQIQARPSMMSPDDSAPAPGHHHGAAEAAAPVPWPFREAIGTVADAYFGIHHALSSDNLENAVKAGRTLLQKLSRVDKKLLTGSSRMEWLQLEKKIEESSKELVEAKDIEKARARFEVLTAATAAAIKTFGSKKTAVYRFHCPMAFNNKGAYWLQKSLDTRNPYFGASMLLCKDKVEPLFPGKKK